MVPPLLAVWFSGFRTCQVYQSRAGSDKQKADEKE